MRKNGKKDHVIKRGSGGGGYAERSRWITRGEGGVQKTQILDHVICERSLSRNSKKET